MVKYQIGKNVKKKIIETIKLSLSDLCECEREKHIQDLLAMRLGCKARITLSSNKFPDIEIDLIGEDFIIEIKYNDKYYAGFDQIIAQRILYNSKQNYLIHIHEYLNFKYVNAFKKLSKELNVNCILINKKTKKIEVLI